VKTTISLFLALSLAAAVSAQTGSKIITPTVSGAQHQPKAGANPSILYHGGPVLATNTAHPLHVYYIFYGQWATKDPGGPAIMTSFMQNLGGSPYWNILTTYKETSGATIQNNTALLKKTYTDTGSQGSNLSDTTLQTVVSSAISGGHLPLDPTAIYEVLTSPEVNETSGFCSSYCGFHGHTTISGKDIKYAFIGDPVHCTSYGGVADCQGLSTNITASPNNDPGVDAMISVIAHETEEATSDPDLNAWYFASGNENGDQCAYTYGTTTPAGNGSVYNITLGGKKYAIQQDWVAPNLGCAMSH